jgi:hypothetical protein
VKVTRRTLVIAAAAAALLGGGGPPAHAADAGPTATPAGGGLQRCDISGRERRLGATYVTSLFVRGVGCRSAERVVRSYHACRRRSGRCRSRVRRYRCSERRLRSGPTQYDARVTCRRGSRRIRHDYTQFT